jgi:hypothetical protein
MTIERRDEVLRELASAIQGLDIPRGSAGLR